MKTTQNSPVSRRPRLLFVSPRFPYPPIQGDRLRAYELLGRLRDRYQITLLAPDAPDATHVARALGVEWIPVHVARLPALLAIVAALPSKLPLQVAYLCPPALLHGARRILAECRHDLLHIHTIRAAPVAGLTHLPVVFDFIDPLSLNMRRRAEHEHIPLRWLFQHEADRLQQYERKLLDQSAATMVVAATDLPALGNHPRLHVITSGINLDTFTYTEANRDPATIIFSGRMAYYPNADAARFLALEILPLVRAQLPTAQLRIVGADPPPSVRDLAICPGVTVTGYVEQIAVELQRATVAAAPIRTGTGIQTKVMEAMACGTPVVATAHALAGIAAQPGLHALVAEEAQPIAQALIRLMMDAQLRLQLARAARKWVELRYTWDATADAVDALYQEALGMYTTRRSGPYV